MKPKMGRKKIDNSCQDENYTESYCLNTPIKTRSYCQIEYFKRKEKEKKTTLVTYKIPTLANQSLCLKCLKERN